MCGNQASCPTVIQWEQLFNISAVRSDLGTALSVSPLLSFVTLNERGITSNLWSKQKINMFQDKHIGIFICLFLASKKQKRLWSISLKPVDLIICRWIYSFSHSLGVITGEKEILKKLRRQPWCPPIMASFEPSWGQPSIHSFDSYVAPFLQDSKQLTINNIKWKHKGQYQLVKLLINQYLLNY